MAKKPRRLHGLSEHSVFYKKNAGVYEKFSMAEDAPGRILRVIAPKVRGKAILDMGCGTGKYAKLLSPHVHSYCGVDISAHQLAIAKKKLGNCENVLLVETDASTMKLPKASFDAAVAFWALSPVAGWDRKRKVIERIMGTLKKGGSFYLIENDKSGKFEEVRGSRRREETEEYNRWLARQGFKVIKKVNTYFEFSSKKEAQKIFTAIWGNEVGQKVDDKRVGHNVLIFKKTK
jgi:ubiquinone/menaquinone biosynthesis C-methylase UbiE